ncbi:uncharacterized protein XM38_049840 [Halomicronema hongdechloris C2206]|uniref:MOSC domain-containing protein n=1 Tax=Halomicronema hongdechloris C2206 TaxID=1641165 RepID=A0A1Z3HUL6_9CYAN|nr:MOSC N-terminal beta barrel domain-containing protein [Halomicronema hongdechloris]ASC74010.1 uncharacterized protein XM38_049840 [Halomicronema hongdechloris C2206]
MAYLARIALYPIKSLDGITVSQTTVLPSGALRCDRTYALFDQQGRFINGKRNARVHHLRSAFSNDIQTLTLTRQDTQAQVTFHLEQQRPELEAWLSDYFQQPVHLGHNPDQGFPDDTESPGPTVISTATLETVASWYPELTLEEVRRRFRTNLEIAGVPAFWEDQLYGPQGTQVSFQIGTLQLQGVNPCQRCVVPVRDTLTGAATPAFQQTFMGQRRATLPDWADRSRFNHFYRLAVNTRASRGQGETAINVGDPVYLSSAPSDS